MYAGAHLLISFAEICRHIQVVAQRDAQLEPGAQHAALPTPTMVLFSFAMVQGTWIVKNVKHYAVAISCRASQIHDGRVTPGQ